MYFRVQAKITHSASQPQLYSTVLLFPVYSPGNNQYLCVSVGWWVLGRMDASRGRQATCFCYWRRRGNWEAAGSLSGPKRVQSRRLTPQHTSSTRARVNMHVWVRSRRTRYHEAPNRFQKIFPIVSFVCVLPFARIKNNNNKIKYRISVTYMKVCYLPQEFQEPIPNLINNHLSLAWISFGIWLHLWVLKLRRIRPSLTTWLLRAWKTYWSAVRRTMCAKYVFRIQSVALVPKVLVPTPRLLGWRRTLGKIQAANMAARRGAAAI